MNKDQKPKNGIPYLEAFPFYRFVTDLCDLESDEKEFARLMVEALQQGKMETTFQSHSKSEEKLHHIHFESRSWERIGGQRCTAIGFPLFLTREGSSVKLAPLLIWPVTLDPDLHRPNFWTIRSVGEKGPFPNPLLSLLLPEGSAPPVPGWQPSTIPDVESIQQYGKEIASLLETTWQESWVAPYPIPPLEVMSDLADQRVILPCMVLGSFKPAFLPAEDETFWAYDETPVVRQPNRQAFERMRFSPTQAMAWERAQKGKTTLVESLDQKATLDWVAELILNALSNGERTLVISDRINRLSQIQHKLAGQGNEWLTFFLKDPYQDSYLLAELLKARIDKEESPTSLPQDDFKVALAKCIRQKEKLDSSYQALQKKLLGPYNWTDLVGLYLKSSAIEGKELLSSQLSTQDLLFQFEEYEAFKQVIAKSIPLFNKVNTLKHPLTALHPSHFLRYEKEASLRRLEKMVADFTRQLEELNHEVLRQTDAYALKLNDHLEQGFLSLNARLQQTLDEFSDHSHKFGDSFQKTGASRLKGLFNNKAKELAKAREETTQSYLALARHHQDHNFFDFSFLIPGEAKNMAKVKDSLSLFKETLSDWRQRIRDRVLEEVARLNSKTVYPDLGFQETIEQLEVRIDGFLTDFNEAQMYAEQVDANMLTLPKKQKFLDSLLEKLETTRLNLRDFDPFYDWQRHWLQMSDPQQRVMRALIKVKPQNWVSAFESWYLHHCLSRAFSDELPTDDQPLQMFCESWSNLQAYLPSLSHNLWQERQQKSFKAWKKSHKTGFQFWTGKSKRTGPPKAWFDGNWEGLHDLYPVWMMPDSLTATLYDAENSPELDWVIVWENQEIEPDIWNALAPKVKHWVFIGDRHGKHFNRLKSKGWTATGITPLSPALPFHIVSGQPEPDPTPSVPVQNVPVRGLYDFSRHTNEAEAQEVIRLLNDIRPTPARTFPSVCILTFTEEQKDLISTYLLQIKQRNQQGSEKIRSLERNGLVVLHVDEFHGASFDQIILSTTLGPINIQGDLPANLSYFHSPGFERSAAGLIQSGAQRLYLLHSFSDAHLSDLRLQPFLKIMEGKEKAGAKAANSGQAPEFNLQLGHILRGYFDDWECRQFDPQSTFRLPAVLYRDQEQPYAAALLPDLFFSTTAFTSYTWEWDAREAFIKQGYHLQHAWSLLFWRNHRQEARKMASRIITGRNKILKEDSAIAEDLPEEGSEAE